MRAIAGQTKGHRMTVAAQIEHGKPLATLADGWRAHLVPLALLAFTVIATRAVWFNDPVADFDEQLYSFIGWRMTHGELPYVDWWDRKPFGLFAIFALAHWLMGPEALAYQLLAALSCFAAAWLTYDLARFLVGRFSATMAAAIAVMLISAYGAYSAQSEVFFAPIMLAMLRLLVEREHPAFARRAMIAMALGGIALQIKYTVLPQCVFLGLYALWIQHKNGNSVLQLIGKAALYAVLGLLPTLLIIGYYALQGGFDAYIFANFVSFFDRIPAPQGRWTWMHGYAVAPLAILGIGGLFAATRMVKPRDWHIWLLFTGSALACLAGVLLPSTVYVYYYAALAAPAALVALPAMDRDGPAKGAIGLLLVLACFSILTLDARRARALAERDATATLVAAISPHVGADKDCLWLFDGPTALYRLTNSCVPTRFVYPDHLNNALEVKALDIVQDVEVARILANSPGAIVTADKAVTLQNEKATLLVKAALALGYERSVTVPMHGRNLTAWVRKK